MKHLIGYALLFVTVISCNDNTDKSPEMPTGAAKDSPFVLPKTKTVIKVDAIILPNIIFNEAYTRNLNSDKLLLKSEIDHLQIKKIDKDMSAAFKYFSKNIVVNDSGTIILISRAYTEENIAWLAIYDDKAKLSDFKQVYYDNSEGFLSIETTIKNNLIVIKTANDFAEKEKDKLNTENYHINARHRFVKQ